VVNREMPATERSQARLYQSKNIALHIEKLKLLRSGRHILRFIGNYFLNSPDVRPKLPSISSYFDIRNKCTGSLYDF